MIDSHVLASKFQKIGARLELGEPGRRRARPDSISFDVRSDREGEYFAVEVGRLADSVEVEVLDVRPADRHLLVLVREGAAKSKFLCGHDERHWFVAAIPEAAPVGTVPAAKEALKPPQVIATQARLGLGAAARNRRKNAAYRRQGEWFFLPEPAFRVDPKLVLRDEPMTRGTGSKPHRVEFLYREGGEAVYTSRLHPHVLTSREYRRLLSRRPDTKNWGWTLMRRNPDVYARGRIRHADHDTITLHDSHRVLMNTENQARAMRHVAFLD